MHYGVWLLILFWGDYNRADLRSREGDGLPSSPILPHIEKDFGNILALIPGGDVVIDAKFV